MLAGAWRQIVKDLKIDNAMLYEKISMYTDSLTHIPLKKRTQIRGNMRTDVFKDNLTWYTFCKNLRILNVAILTIEFECKHSRRTSKHQLTELLNDDFATKKEKSKEKDEEEGNDVTSLSQFFAEMMFNLGVDYQAFEALLDYFMHRTGIAYTPQTKNEMRAYLRKQFKDPKMSWNSLINGFLFLCIYEVKMTISLTYGYGLETKHHYVFVLGNSADFLDETEEEQNGL